ncbi:MAG: PAS domain S-box protein, partial [Leptolyngbyaceae cyanobacterium bins.59]|nr:PAS domain S-box protein [Leptolyngbyaceae cyanobacterium bins.59]
MNGSLCLAEDDPFFVLSPDMLCIIGINGYFKRLNPVWERAVGFSVAELQSHPYLEWIHPDDREVVKSAVYQLSLEAEAICFESRQLCHNGCYRWFAWTIAPLGSEGLLYAILRDVTGQRQTIEALRQAELQYRSIFENATEGIFQSTPEGRYLNVNPALVRIYGYDSAEALIKQLTDIEHQLYVDPQRRQTFAQLMQEQGMVEGFESLVYRKDGRQIWISEDAHVVYNPDGELLYYEGSVRDITAHKMAEVALQESEAHNRVLLNAIPDVMFCIHRNGTYRNFRVPTDFETLFAMSGAEGQAIRQFLPENVIRNGLPQIERALETGEIQIFEYQWSLNNRTREYEVRLVVSGPEEVLAIVRDITERKQVERLKNEFVSVVSHELRTPLTSIRGSLGLICGGVVGELPTQVKDLIQIAYKNSERLVVLINDILDIEKIESGQMNFEMKSLALVPLVEQAIEGNRAYGQQYGVQFNLETSLPEIKVQADANRLIQVLTNLLSNAAKFSPCNGTVQVVVRSEEEGWVRVAVSDRGPGIPGNFRDRVFQKFAQADASDTRQKGGTGLGLSISKAIIERMGGFIGFQTETQV